MAATILTLSSARQSAFIWCPVPAAAAEAAVAGPVPSLNCSTPGLSGLLFYFIPALPFLFVPVLSFSLLHFASHFLIFRTLPISSNKGSSSIAPANLDSTQIISSCLIMPYVIHSLRPWAYFGMALYFRKQILLLIKASEPVICANLEILYKLF